jgi:outer membrane protein assembly factor BamB
MPSTKRKIRWWPGLAIVMIWSGALVFIWSSGSDEFIRQNQVTASLVFSLLAGPSLLVWATLFSRLSTRPRLVALGGFLVVLIGFFGGFRYRGVSGDLVPQFEPRFGSVASDFSGGSANAKLPELVDYAEFLGPNRDATLPGLGLVRDWSRRPPRQIWRQPVGRAWSGFSVSGNVAVTQEQHSAEERVVAYETATGKVLWASREVAHYENALAGQGPRATPTIKEGAVFAMGATGILTALDLASGELLWKQDVLTDNGTKLPTWGKSDSPLVVDGRVIVSAGAGDGAGLVAYDAESGERVWRGGEEPGAYGSPMLVSLGGIQQILSFNADSVSGHDPRSGALIWREPWPREQPNVAQPLVLPEDRLLVSSGYGVGAKLFAIESAPGGELRSRAIWESIRLKSKLSNVVYHEGHLYGLDDGILVCLDPSDGRRLWKRGRYGHGQLLLIGDVILLQGEHGEVFLIEPNPSDLRELTSFRAFEQKIWNPPALAGRYLLMRNDAEAALYELPVI